MVGGMPPGRRGVVRPRGSLLRVRFAKRTNLRESRTIDVPLDGAGMFPDAPEESAMNKILRTVVLLAVLFPGFAWSDQNAPALDGLFNRLWSPATTPAEARTVTGRIWNLWLASEDPKAQQLMARGIRQMNQFALDEAARIFTDLIDIAPDFAEAWNKRATVFYMMGQYEQSTADVGETLRLEPRHFGALSGQGLIYMETGRPAEALHWFRRALDVNPFMEGVRQNVKMLEETLEGKVI